MFTREDLISKMLFLHACITFVKFIFYYIVKYNFTEPVLQLEMDSGVSGIIAV